MGKKQPRVKESPKSGVPKVRHEPENFDRHRISWQFCRADLQHDRWGWHVLDHADFVELFTAGPIKDLETQTWAELKSGKQHHSIAVYKLCRDAQKRLVDLNLDDQDEVFSLRLSGRRRVFGIRSGTALQLLWNDPEHEICPSKKKYT